MSPGPPFLDWLVAFAGTCAIELPVYTFLLRRRFRSLWAPCLVALFVNLVTHPALWYLAPRMEPYWLWLLIAESSVILVETLLIAAILRVTSDSPRPLGIAWLSAMTANFISTALGLFAYAIRDMALVVFHR